MSNQKEQPLHVVIPVRMGTQNETLRYAVRAWETHFPGVEITIIGGRPVWWRGRHVGTDQRQGTVHQWTRNFPLAMRAALSLDLDGPFWWSADDIFPLEGAAKAMRGNPTFCRLADLDVYLAKWEQKRAQGYTQAFIDGMKSQRDIIRALGLDTQHNADMHMPHLIDPLHLEELLDDIFPRFPDHPVGHFRAVYGALWPTEGGYVRIKDPKVVSHNMIDRDLPFASTSSSSFSSRAGAELRRLFTTPSRFERF